MGKRNAYRSLVFEMLATVLLEDRAEEERESSR
jgi:hypothetical protein